jgi:hypothetical protein
LGAEFDSHHADLPESIDSHILQNPIVSREACPVSKTPETTYYNPVSPIHQEVTIKSNNFVPKKIRFEAFNEAFWSDPEPYTSWDYSIQGPKKPHSLQLGKS